MKTPVQEFFISFYHKLSKKYIIAVVDSKTLRQLATHKVTLKKIIFLIFFYSFSLILFAVLIHEYVSFHSIGSSYKSSASFGKNPQEVNKKIKKLETDLDLYKNQVDKLKEILTGNSTSSYLSANSSEEKTAIKPKPSTYKLQLPLKGYITEHFSLVHPSIDIASKKGEKIKAIYSGYVVYTGWAKETGNTIIIQHPNNILSIYKHCNSLLATTKSKIEAQQEIATVGSTGDLSSGSHLHFELWSNGKPLNPEKYIKFK